MVPAPFTLLPKSMRRAKKAFERAQVNGRLSQAKGSLGIQRLGPFFRFGSEELSCPRLGIGDVGVQTRKGKITEAAKESTAWRSMARLPARWDSAISSVVGGWSDFSAEERYISATQVVENCYCQKNNTK
jgi:hypothetical protein